MPIPIKHEINITLKDLQKLIDNWNTNIIQELFKREPSDKVTVLETSLVALLNLRREFNDEIDKLSNKIQKEIDREKKRKNNTKL